METPKLQRPPLTLLVLRPGIDRCILAYGNPPIPIELSYHYGWDRLSVIDSFFHPVRPQSIVLRRWTDSMVCVEILKFGSWTPPKNTNWFHPSELSGCKKGFVPALTSITKWTWLLPSSKNAILYHGTTKTAAESILKNGFQLPTCIHNENDLSCKCGMMGNAVYLALFDKAEEYAKRTPDYRKREDGVILRCVVDMTNIIVKSAKPHCICGCNQPFVDHFGSWYKCDSPPTGVWLKSGSKPAVRRPELAVRDISIIKPLEIIRCTSEYIEDDADSCLTKRKMYRRINT